jgi:DNA-binding NarL/FixJ family response regulator
LPRSVIAVVADDEVRRRRLARALAEHPTIGADELRSGETPDAIVSGCADDHVRATLEGLGEVGAPIVLVLPTASRADVREALAAGARGIVVEDTVEASLEPTLDAVLAGQLVLPPTGRAHLAPPVLSAREKQVLGLVVLGLSNVDVAAKLHITEATVKSHLTACFRKLGVRTRSAAVARILDPHEGLGVGILSLAETDTSLDVFAEA